jgi:hypothetical protein
LNNSNIGVDFDAGVDINVDGYSISFMIIIVIIIHLIIIMNNNKIYEKNS